ncbi:MAG: TolC family protein [Bacteroidetes bacterium]|nr:TolC family protein [Bacteroidota bacterium]MBK9354639.1 TolC family protein [Bacteroidota bacterium]MBK9634289.1 TolC family protein [Bacteroidota bacterium]
MKIFVNIRLQIVAIIVLLIVQSAKLIAQESKYFASINEVIAFTKNNNITFQNANYENQMSDITTKTAIGNLFNPKIPTSIQVLDNINQQVSFLPGQAFGQPIGTFKEVTIGQQYVSTFNIQPQFDILNMANYALIKTTKINQQLVENQHKINEQNLYEKINIVYFNILTFNGQKEIVKENIIIAKDILRIITNKFNEGVARKQEVNEAEVNLISLQDKFDQIEINTKIQYQTLNLFFENKIDAILSENIWNYQNTDTILKTQNNLIIENVTLQTQMAQQENKALKYQNLPVLSFVSSLNWQNLSNDFSFAKNSNWINYNYIGLKLSYDLPTTVQKITNQKSKQIQIQILKNNEKHSLIENESKNAQMILEYEKSLKQKENLWKIHDLKKDTYEKNFNQFKENILPLDKLLISQNDMLVSKLNIVSSLANIGFNKTKIEINNGF